MKANMSRSKGQIYCVGNYLMTGKVLGKGNFARVEEATHRIIGKKVAIKIIDLTLIKEEYARRNLHREPRVMAKLRHPCIAALYETMMHGPRLYVVMEAAGGGDLCTHVLSARGATRGLPEPRAQSLAVQLVSAVRHMHARGVVHRDLKMENIMLDNTKQFIKIVDFGLSNLWSSGASLRTPCGSLEYAAPELFVDGRKYGPEVDLWSIGVIVYGMVTGALPFTGEGDARSRPRLRADIARGLAKKQRAALACHSIECRSFIQQLLEPNVENRMKIEEASRHRWIKRIGMKMKTHPLGSADPATNREIYRQISELCSQTIMDVVAQIKAEPFGATGGMFNIKMHLCQLQAASAVNMLWSTVSVEPRPASPPDYKPTYDSHRSDFTQTTQAPISKPFLQSGPVKPSRTQLTNWRTDRPIEDKPQSSSRPRIPSLPNKLPIPQPKKPEPKPQKSDLNKPSALQSPRFSVISRPLTSYSTQKPSKVYDSGDCGLDPRLPSIDEHSNTDLNDKNVRVKSRTPFVRRVTLDSDKPRLNSCPNKTGDTRRSDFCRRSGYGLPSWRSGGAPTPPTRILLQTNATTIKRASLGNIVSPHSSSNSHCKSERAMPVSWYTRNAAKDPPHLQRFRRTAPMK